MLFKKKLTKKLKQPETYNSVDDLPIKIWFKIHDTGDLSLLCKGKQIYFDGLEILFETIYNEFISRFGFSDEYLSDLERKKRLANLQADFIITKQRHFKTLIAVEKEIQRQNAKDVSKQDLEITLAKISKYYGFKLSSRDLTVAEYYSYINNIN